MLLTPHQIKQIYDNARDQLHSADPLPILESLNLNIVQVNPISYKLNLRDERHASAFISLINKKWVYKDFGNNSSGTIENIVMLVLRHCYKDALTYCLSVLNKNEPIARNSSSYTNLSQVKHTNKSKVLQVREPSDYTSVLTYLKSRKITKIPPEFRAIEGVYYNKNNEPKKVFGVGILNDTGGADIHFLKKIGNLKTMNLGAKDISFYTCESASKLAIFESKMDYAAAHQQIDFSTSHILIANSTSSVHKVINKIHELNLELDITFFQQNDSQGCEFARQIVQKTHLSRFNYVKYLDLEYGLDINDLILKNIKIEDRLKMYNQIITYDKYLKKNRH